MLALLPKQPSTEQFGSRLLGSLPISQVTLQGLESNAYTNMTPIQLAGIPHTLTGRDILVAAKMGSGKMLAFLVLLGMAVLTRLDATGWSHIEY
jgi:superfamily II DNA/RNA helicase